jgi:4-hydroxy-2-oxoheptanedioate aldolase
MSEALRAKLARGEPVVVVNPDHPSASLVERLGRLPIDAVFIDCEQGSPDVESVEHMARAARLTGVASLVRLYTREDWAIERYLGRGVDGIVVPRLEKASEAQNVVAAVRYCYPRDHARKLVVIQIETRSALEGLDDFLAVDGVDVLFLGPIDLSKSLGHGGDYRGEAMLVVMSVV